MIRIGHEYNLSVRVDREPAASVARKEENLLGGVFRECFFAWPIVRPREGLG